MNKLHCLALVILSAACTSSPPEPSPGAASPPASTSVDVRAAGSVIGYVHTASASRFALGDVVRTEQQAGATRVIGTHGVLAITASGATLGVPNADAPSTRVGPLTQISAEHTARVLRYFTGAGLPRDQIGDTHITTTMQNSGSVRDVDPTRAELVAYTTVLDRKLDGVRVEGSYAWARFNANDEAVAEEVYWPELPLTVLGEARELRARLASADLRASLPSHLRDAPLEVVIHHTPQGDDALHTMVSIDVYTPAMPHALHFDGQGREIQLARATKVLTDTLR